MGSVVEDAFYPPHDLAAEIQTFLADHEHLFGGDPTWAEVAVVYGIKSNAVARAAVELPADNRENVMFEGDLLAFDQVSRVLAASAQPYDVLFFPEGELRPDTLLLEDLTRYRTIVVPGCDVLTPHQMELLEGFVAAGGRLVVLGELGVKLADAASALLRNDLVRHVAAFGFSVDQLADGPQVRVLEGRTDLSVSLQRIEAGAALHLLRYDYDEVADRVPPLDRLVLEVRLPFEPGAVEAASPHGDLVAAAEPLGPRTLRLVLRDVPLYGIVRIPGSAA
jgi:hypothetical protein